MSWKPGVREWYAAKGTQKFAGQPLGLAERTRSRAGPSRARNAGHPFPLRPSWTAQPDPWRARKLGVTSGASAVKQTAFLVFPSLGTTGQLQRLALFFGKGRQGRRNRGMNAFVPAGPQEPSATSGVGDPPSGDPRFPEGSSQPGAP